MYDVSYAPKGTASKHINSKNNNCNQNRNCSSCISIPQSEKVRMKESELNISKISCMDYNLWTI